MGRPNIGDVFEYFPKNHEHTYLAVITHEHPKKNIIFRLGNIIIRGFTYYNYSASIYALKKGEDDLLHFDPTDRKFNGLIGISFSKIDFRPVNASRINLSSLLEGKKPIKFPKKEAG